MRTIRGVMASEGGDVEKGEEERLRCARGVRRPGLAERRREEQWTIAGPMRFEMRLEQRSAQVESGRVVCGLCCDDDVGLQLER